MKLNYLALSALTLSLGITGLMTAKAYGAPPAPVQGYGQDRGGWDQAPREFHGIQQQGFRDGIEGARKDVDNHRRPDVNNRDEYRHPRYFGREAEDYRSGFRRGYDMAMSHLMNGGPQQAPPPPPQPYGQNPQGYGNRGGWDAPPSEFREIQQRGFHDGIDGFHRDMDNHRRPDPNNRDEYRNPSVPFRDRADYRAAFRRGYQAAMSHFNYR
jgi:ribosome modulation factor